MDTITESLQTPIVAAYDVVVAGCGIAGIASALAAAREGQRVLVIDRGFLPGGLATAGLVTVFLPLCDGLGHQVSFGIAEELLRLSIRHGSESAYPSAWLYPGREAERYEGVRFEAQFNPQWFAMELDRLLSVEGVEVLYGATVCATHVARERIRCLMVDSKSGRFAVTGKVYIDATGDADLCALSGEETILYERGNPLAAWYYRVSDGAVQLHELGLVDTPASRENTDPEKKDSSLERFDALNAWELSRMMRLSREWVFSDLEEYHATHADCVPVTLPTIPQVRMTRRLKGLYTLKSGDTAVRFDDCVGWFSDWRQKGVCYPLPLRSLQCKTIQNLLVAGRCISAEDKVLDAARAIPACAVTGEAAGTAAALACRDGMFDTSSVTRRLMEKGVIGRNA